MKKYTVDELYNRLESKVFQLKYIVPFEEDEIKRFLEIALDIYNGVEDPCHGIDHAIDVVERSFEIMEKMGVHCIDEITGAVLIAALFHDIGLAFGGRENHHNVGAEWMEVNGEKLFNRNDAINIPLVVRAIQEHRASYEGEYSSIISRIVSVADRQRLIPGCYEVYKIAYSSHLSQEDTEEKALIKAHQHVKKKYGVNGYAYRNNSLYTYLFDEEIAKFQVFVNGVTLEDVRQHMKIQA